MFWSTSTLLGGFFQEASDDQQAKPPVFEAASIWWFQVFFVDLERPRNLGLLKNTGIPSQNCGSNPPMNLESLLKGGLISYLIFPKKSYRFSPTGN